MDSLRDVSRQYGSYLRFQVLPRAGNIFGNWPSGVRACVLGRSAEFGVDVRRDLLDAARLDVAGLGAVRRHPCRNSARNLQLLGKQLLGWCGCGAWRRVGAGCSAADQGKTAGPGRGVDGNRLGAAVQ